MTSLAKRAGAALGWSVFACSAALRTVPIGPEPATAPPPILVDAPPPPAKIEHVPPDPGAPCAWLDGQWGWVGETWEWTPGAWVVPPADCHFVPGRFGWAEGADRSLLFFAPGRWYHDESSATCAAPAACNGSGPPASK